MSSTTEKQQRRTKVVAARLEPDLHEQFHTKAQRLRLTDSSALRRAVLLLVKQEGDGA